MKTALEKGLSRPLRTTLDFIDTRILEIGGGADLGLPPLDNRQRGIELLLVLLAALFYCLPFLDLNSLNNLRGNESRVFQSLDQLLVLGIQHSGHFPLWNPYIYGGIPYAADPMLHAYNPFISMPVLLFGTQAGFKIAVFLAFLIGAFGMWWLARVMRLGVVSRIWMSLLYTFAGATMQRFFQGQYLLQIATGWLPWIIAGVYASLITRRRRHIALAALSLALLFLCGNAYYAYYSLYAIAILALVMVLRWTQPPVRPRIDLPGINALTVIGVLAIGLIAAQLLPVAGFWNRIAKQTDRSLDGSQTLQQVWLDLTSKDAHRADAFAALPSEEFYAYVGIAPFALLVFLPLGWRKGSRRIVAYFVLLAVFAALWIDVRQMPWKGLFENVAFFYQFRYPTRMLIFATLALVALSGIAVDGIMRRLDSFARRTAARPLSLASAAAKYLLMVILLAAIVDVAAANRGALSSDRYYSAPDVVLGWLKQQDSGNYYIAAPNGWHEAVFANQLRYLNSWYHFNDIRSLDGRINTRDLQAAPKYEIIGNDAPAPPGSVLVRTFSEHSIYLHPDALPFAFTVPTSALTVAPSDGAPFAASETTAVDTYTPDTDSIEAIVSGQPGRTLVVLSTLAPGWQLTIDNHRMPLLNVSGYLATGLMSGTHRYVFTFRPSSVPAGWLISLLTLIVTLTLGLTDASLNWRTATQRVRSTDWQGWLDRMRHWKPLPVPEGTAPGGSASIWEHARYQIVSLRRVPAIVYEHVTWQSLLFTASVGIYIVAALYRNANFPIFFFTDEAVHMNQAADLLLHGFRNSQHEFLPTYFYIGSMFSLNSLSVYLQVIPFLLFGKSVAVTRGVSGLITAFGAIAAGLTLRNVFKLKDYWLGVLLLIATPVWFLHSRTAFEYAELAAFYSIFIYCYLQYRSGKPAYLPAAVLSGAAVFYTHGLGQVLMGVTALALFTLDFRFHFRRENRSAFWVSLAAAVLVAVPYVRYQVLHPDITAGEIAQRGSYWMDSSLSIIAKFGRFVSEYIHGLSPLYLYVPNDYDLIRHVMKGYGNIWIATLPFALLGLYIAIRNIRDPRYRVLVVALLAAPIPASIVAIGIIRELWLMVPVALFTALGIEKSIEWLKARQHAMAYVAPALVFVALTGYTLHMLRDALDNGPRWYQDYSLYGLQYGGQQVFSDTILTELERERKANFVVSPNWANGTDQLLFFFIPPQYQDRVSFGTVDDFMSARQDLTPRTVLVAMPDEYEKAKASPLFSKVRVMQTILYPNGQPGFYLMHLTYAANVDAVFAKMAEEQRQPVEGAVMVRGDPAKITYSRIEAGQPSDLFDGDRQSLVRGVEANPFIVDLVFRKPLPMSSLSADFGHMSVKVSVSLYVNEEDTPLQFSSTQMNPPGEPHIDLSFGASYAVTRVHLEISNLDVPGGSAKIHIRELKFSP